MNENCTNIATLTSSLFILIILYACTGNIFGRNLLTSRPDRNLGLKTSDKLDKETD